MSRSYIESCLEGLVFTRIDTKDSFGVYAVKMGRSSENGYGNYILAFVPIHLALLDRAPISRLEWRNIQSRSIKNGYKLTPQNFSRKQPPVVLVENIERTTGYSRYSNKEFSNIEILLLHNPVKNTVYQYHNKLAIMGCIETFNCVLNTVTRAIASKHTETMGISDSVLPIDFDINTPNNSYNIEYL